MKTQPNLRFLLEPRDSHWQCSRGTDSLTGDSFDEIECNQLGGDRFCRDRRGDGAVASRSIGKSC